MAFRRAAFIAAALQGLTAVAAEATDCPGGKCPSKADVREEDHLLVQLRNTHRTTKTIAKETPEDTETPQAQPLDVDHSWNKCHFVVEPMVPYYWDEECTLGKTGCWADGVDVQCRFCRYEGVECPATGVKYPPKQCQFDNIPVGVSFYYEPLCEDSSTWDAINFTGLGCNADGNNVTLGCRLCGGTSTYSSIECPPDCSFANPPTVPYYWDTENCTTSTGEGSGAVGCMADGIHQQCRYCGVSPYKSCPSSVTTIIPDDQCFFLVQPGMAYYTDTDCAIGMLGCNAGGIEKCRYCGTSGDDKTYQNITCPSYATYPSE